MARWKHRPEGSNWGDFGPDDQLGRINLLTPERRREGLAEAKEGIAFTLSLPLDYPGGNFVQFRAPPVLLASHSEQTGRVYNKMICNSEEVTCDDKVILHTQYSTQWDSLAHHGRHFDADGDGIAEIVYYNGFRAGEHLVGPDGEGRSEAKALGIERLAVAGVQGRGVLIDFRRAFGLDKRAVGYDDLMRTLDEQKVEVRTGDFVLLYSGFDRALLDMKKQPDRAKLLSTGAAIDGGDKRTQRWIEESGLVALCSDNVAVECVDRMLSDSPCAIRLPLHDLCLFRLGIHLGELWYLEELANWLHAHQRSAFLLTAPPLRLPGAVGSPLTPIATV